MGTERIIVNFEPFDRKQSVFVFEGDDGTQPEKVINVPLDEIPRTVQELCKTYNVHEVSLCGCAPMLSKVQEDINTLTSFNNEDAITVTIIDKWR